MTLKPHKPDFKKIAKLGSIYGSLTPNIGNMSMAKRGSMMSRENSMFKSPNNQNSMFKSPSGPNFNSTSRKSTMGIGDLAGLSSLPTFTDHVTKKSNMLSNDQLIAPVSNARKLSRDNSTPANLNEPRGQTFKRAGQNISGSARNLNLISPNIMVKKAEEHSPTSPETTENNDFYNLGGIKFNKLFE